MERQVLVKLPNIKYHESTSFIIIIIIIIIIRWRHSTDRQTWLTLCVLAMEIELKTNPQQAAQVEQRHLKIWWIRVQQRTSSQLYKKEVSTAPPDRDEACPNPWH